MHTDAWIYFYTASIVHSINFLWNVIIGGTDGELIDKEMNSKMLAKFSDIITVK